MSNSEIERQLIRKFGVVDVIKFCNMMGEAYRIMDEDVRGRGIANEFDYDFDSQWWANRYNEYVNKLGG